VRALTISLLALGADSCAVRGLVLDGVAEALSGSAQAFAGEDDPELVRDALPFALKANEALLAKDPRNEELLLSAAAGFTQYASAFVEADADRVEREDYERATALRERALRLYLRARDYGLAGLEARHAGIAAELRVDPRSAVTRLGAEDVPLAYWTAAAWGLAVSAGLDRPEIAADVDAVRGLFARSLELDEAWGQGAVHEALISIEALPEAMGGSKARAREHFRRAVELSGGKRAGPYVTLARSVAVGEQDRPGFEELLRAALAIDPRSDRGAVLSNRLAQDRAAFLLDNADELFLPSPESAPE
jgi:hypothetical protein